MPQDKPLKRYGSGRTIPFDFFGDIQTGINVGVDLCGKVLNIIGRIIFLYAVSFKNIDSFVVGNGRFRYRRINADQINAVDMDGRFIESPIISGNTGHAVIRVENLNVFVTQISKVSVYKPVIPAFHRIIFDSLTVFNVILHTVIRHKKMSLPLHDFM